MSHIGEYYKRKHGGGGGRSRQEGRFASATPGREVRGAVVQDRSMLSDKLRALDGCGYGAYKSVVGCWEVDSFLVFIDKAQVDPYAPPGKFRFRLPQTIAQFPPELFEKPIRNVALCDFLTRICHRYLKSASEDVRIELPGQYVLARSSFVMNHEFVEARILVQMPSVGKGRTIAGIKASTLICHEVISLLKRVMIFSSISQKEVYEHVRCVEDQEYLRCKLPELGLVGFIGNGSCLPRKSPVDDTPLTTADSPNVVLFKSPPELEIEVSLPNQGTVRGMKIPRGITLIVGGGFHGKTTLLEAIQTGIYNKIPGDGRELVVTDENAVKIRAEDGRVVTACDISAFINNLPFGKSSSCFSSPDASGSTSQAANIIEALEMGASTLLVDEDTSATNFMIRDARMQALVAAEKEPITPFLHKIVPLYKQHGVSTLMVVGGSGDYFDVADLVILMHEYSASCVTKEAKEVAHTFNFSVPRQYQVHTPELLALKPFGSIQKRQIDGGSLRPSGKLVAKSRSTIAFGHSNIDLSCVEQIVETAQTKAISCFIAKLADNFAKTHGIGSGARSFKELVGKKCEELCKSSRGGVTGEGLNAWSTQDFPVGDLALPRPFEIAFAIARIRGLRVLGNGS